MTSPVQISPTEAQRMIAAGARLIDIRGRDEHARARIPDAINVPLAELATIAPGTPVIFHCRSGARTAANASRLAVASNGEWFCLEGGLEQWRTQGLPVVEDLDQPIEIMRQVQIAAGTLVLIGVAMGLLVAPGFFALAGFVGAGLTFAGVSGWCGMAKLLSIMPWNRRTVG